MTAVLLMLSALAAVACWVCASPARLAVAGGVLLVTHPAPTLALTALVVAGLTAASGVLVYRSLRDGGWHLVTVCRPNLAPALSPALAPAGGGAR
ncbi:hypothetical protein ACFQY7_55790 [Actinomadura luteofluorescens]|uniref:Histidine kinase n=1 Tax=Actinomadura luteofluorescens TaxID=46163 RepID=A0A7Y9JE95_9ACTN|nr:hypothetical protein [Actinomadura luteofluorescens]NYD45685.1 hypothetical protein [Actinomadura luteofluorescens]